MEVCCCRRDTCKCDLGFTIAIFACDRVMRCCDDACGGRGDCWGEDSVRRRGEDVDGRGEGVGRRGEGVVERRVGVVGRGEGVEGQGEALAGRTCTRTTCCVGKGDTGGLGPPGPKILNFGMVIV